MKIGIIVPGFSASESDWCIPALLNLVRELSRQADVHVFALRYPHARNAYLVYDATVHPLGAADLQGIRRLTVIRRAISAVRAEHRRGRFDLLHAFWADEPGAVAAISGRILAVPIVVSLAGGELANLADIGYGGQLNLLNRWLTRMAVRRAARLTTGSTALAMFARAHFGRAFPSVLPLGVDTDMFTPACGAGDESDRASGHRLLHVASLVPVKDQATLLRALALIRPHQPGAHLDIVGDGPLRASLITMADELGVADSVTFHGSVSHDRMPQFFQAADLHLLSSRYEAQGMVVLEAAACGVPTVGTAVGIMTDIARMDQIVPIGDAGRFANAVLKLLDNPECLRGLGEAARETVRMEFSLEHTVDKTLTLYREITQR